MLTIDIVFQMTLLFIMGFIAKFRNEKEGRFWILESWQKWLLAATTTTDIHELEPFSILFMNIDYWQKQTLNRTPIF